MKTVMRGVHPWTLYHLYDGETCLYVGISTQVEKRLAKHRQTRGLSGFTRATTEYLGEMTFSQAHEFETTAIHVARPTENRANNPVYWERQQRAHEEYCAFMGVAP